MAPKKAATKAAPVIKGTTAKASKAKAAAAPVDEFDVEGQLKLLGDDERALLTSADFKEACASTFRMCDLHQTGTLDDDELFNAVFKAVSPDRRKVLGITKENVEALVFHFDANKDGKIDSDEFFKFVQWVIAKEIRDYFTGATGKALAEGAKSLDKALDELCKLYDTDGEGRIERACFLAGEEEVEVFLEGRGAQLSTQQRRALIQAFKGEMCAEGDMKTGLYITYDKFKENFPKRLVARMQDSPHLDERTKALDPQVHPQRFCDWLRGKVVDPFIAQRTPKKVVDPEAGLDPEVPPTLPTYPVTVKLPDLATAVNTATPGAPWFQLRAPVCIAADGADQVESWLGYQNCITIDCKAMVGQIYAHKKLTKEEAKGQMRDKVKTALNSSGFTKHVWFRMNNSAFTLQEYIDDKDGLPAALFEPGFTSAKAHACGLIDDPQKLNLEAVPSKFNDFKVIISSTFDINGVNEHLKDLPGFKTWHTIALDTSDLH